MLNVTEVVEKIFRQPEKFEQCMKAGDYSRAKWCFINTVFVSTFIELDKEEEDKLFEMFSEEEVREAFGGKRADDKGDRPS